MKKLLSLVIVAFTSLLAVIPSAYAATTTGGFNVIINLTSACSITTAAGNVTFNYTSLGVIQTPTSTVGVTCTNTLPYTLKLSNADNAVPAASITTTDSKVNLIYSLSVPAASQTGTGSAVSHTISGSMAAGQAGTCATATCTNAGATNLAQTLTVTY